MSIIINNKEDKLTLNVVDNTGVIDHIPAAVYTVSVNPMTGTVNLHKDVKRFNVPERIYGKSHPKRLSMIMDEFKSRESSLGVILHGLKGSGKSLLAESIANNALVMDVPVFKIDDSISANVLTFIASVAGSCVFYFDEYSKYYHKEEHQNEMLTFFSNSAFKKVLFLVCDNTLTRFSEYLIDRPGRFLFRIKYRGIERDAVEEICKINALSDDFTNEIISFALNVELSVDVINTLVRFAKRCDSLNELREYYSVLNIPAKKFSKLTVGRLEPLEHKSDFSNTLISKNSSIEEYAIVGKRIKDDTVFDLYKVSIDENSDNEPMLSLVESKTMSYMEIAEKHEHVHTSESYVRFSNFFARLNITSTDADLGDTYVLIDTRADTVDSISKKAKYLKERIQERDRFHRGPVDSVYAQVQSRG